jgi:glycosyltransferase involved in cell wall biosynthesis
MTSANVPGPGVLPQGVGSGRGFSRMESAGMMRIDQLREKLTAPITVAMPAYNAEQTIEESVRSIQQQTFKDWQLLIVNDHSTDRTAEIALGLAKADRRILVTHSQHRGVCHARNTAFENSNSPYVALLDADDISEPTRFEKQLSFLEAHPEVKALGSWGWRINDTGKIISRFDVGPTTVEQLAKTETVSLINSSVMCRREQVLECGANRPEDWPAEDVALWNRMVAQRYVVLALPERLVRYRINQNGISSRNARLQQLQSERVHRNLQTGENLSLEEYREWVQSRLVRRLGFERRYLQRHYFRKGAAYYYNKQLIRAALFLGISALANPWYTFDRIIKGQ